MNPEQFKIPYPTIESQVDSVDDYEKLEYQLDDEQKNFLGRIALKNLIEIS